VKDGLETALWFERRGDEDWKMWEVREGPQEGIGVYETRGWSTASGLGEKGEMSLKREGEDRARPHQKKEN